MNNEYDNNEQGKYTDSKAFTNNSSVNDNAAGNAENNAEDNSAAAFGTVNDSAAEQSTTAFSTVGDSKAAFNTATDSTVYNSNNNGNNNNSNNNSSNNYNSNNYGSSFDNSYNNGSFSYYDTNSMNQQPGSNPYAAYNTSSDEKKPKKKRRIFGAFKLTAAAVAFGLIAGGVFQGYYAITNPVSQSDTDSNKIQATEVAQTGDSKDTIVPATANTDGVVTDVSDVVSKVMPSIVAINSTANQTSYDFFGRPYAEQSQASGSGIIIGQNGSDLLIATNNHVINGAASVEIVFADNAKAPAEVKGADANSDLAVLTVKMSDLSEATAKAIKVATLGNSDNVKPGQMAIAIGNALGYGQSVTVGYISAVDREVTIGDQTETLLQTDAAINPGNSGGALLNAAGEVIGINSVKYADTDVEGMGYAIPISSAIPMFNELISREVVATGDQGYLGIDASTAQNVTDVYSQRFNMPIGVYVNDVIKNSPADTAGLKQGNIITGLDGDKVETIDDLVSILSYKKEGQEVKLTVQVKENGAYAEKTLTVTLGKKSDK